MSQRGSIAHAGNSPGNSAAFLDSKPAPAPQVAGIWRPVLPNGAGMRVAQSLQPMIPLQSGSGTPMQLSQAPSLVASRPVAPQQQQQTPHDAVNSSGSMQIGNASRLPVIHFHPDHPRSASSPILSVERFFIEYSLYAGKYNIISKGGKAPWVD